MDPLAQLTAEIRSLSAKVDAVEKTARTLKRFLAGMLIASVVAFVLPLIGLAFVIPAFLRMYSSALNF